MMIEAMGNNDPLLLEINLIHFPCQEVHMAQHLRTGFTIVVRSRSLAATS